MRIAETVARPSARTSRLVPVQVAHRSADASSGRLLPPATRGRIPTRRDPIRPILLSVSAAALTLSAASSWAAVDLSPNQPADVARPAFDKNSPFYFDGTILRQTLENYLDRSVTMGYFLVPGKPEGYEFPYKDDDIRLIRNVGAKFIGRSIYRWGQESRLNDPAFFAYAKKMVDAVHAFDPEVIFQGCLFEQVTADVNNLKIPAWVFTDFGLPVEDRTFSCDAIIKRQGRGSDRPGGRGGVPIINNLETQLWFYYLVVSYINVGCEAFHLGQVGLIGAEDRDLKFYSEFLAKVRAYAKTHARRHLVLMDGHVPSGGMVKDGVSLLDFNSFPLRIKAVPEKPYEAVLEVGHLDALFKRSKGCTSPSGWRCESLPYLVEFDNFGRSRTPNVADNKTIFVWGWDEISWFALQPEDYRNHWLRYAYDWIKRTDPNGHLQMPVTRMISCPNQTLRTYFANTKSPACPVGYSQEETIKQIWNHELKPAVQTARGNSGHYVFVPQDYGMPLNNVADVAVDSKNNVFTIVRGETPILVFNPQGKFLYGWGKGMIAGPHGIYIDSNDNVFCDDTKDHVVLKFTTDGKLLMTLGHQRRALRFRQRERQFQDRQERSGSLQRSHQSRDFQVRRHLRLGRLRQRPGPSLFRRRHAHQILGRAGDRPRPVQSASWHRR